MKDIYLIDSRQAYLSVQTILILNSFARSYAGVVIESEARVIRMCKASLLFAPLAGCLHFSVLHSHHYH